MRVWGYADPRLLNRAHLLGEHREIHALLPKINGWSNHPEYARFHDLANYPEPSTNDPHSPTYSRKKFKQDILIPRNWISPDEDPRVEINLKGSNKQGISFLILRHEFVRLAMNARWPRPRKHTTLTHKTPLPTGLLIPDHRDVLLTYAHIVKHPRPFTNRQSAAIEFWDLMYRIHFPRTLLDHTSYRGVPDAIQRKDTYDPAFPSATEPPPLGADTPWHRDFSHSKNPLLTYLQLGDEGWQKELHHIQHRPTTPDA